MNFVVIILNLAAIQGLLVSFFLYHKRKNHKPNLFIASHTLVTSVVLFIFQFKDQDIFVSKEVIRYATFLLLFVSGPLLYLYTTYLTAERKTIDSSLFIHFAAIPISIIVELIFPNSVLYALDYADQPPPNDAFDQLYLLEVVLIISTIGYVLTSFKKVLIFDRRALNLFSNLESANLVWLRNLLGIFSVLLLIHLIDTSFDYSQIDLKWSEHIMTLGFPILIYIISYKALTQPEIFKELRHVEKPQPKAYKNSSLKDSMAKDHINRLLTFMKEEKPYLDCNLTIEDLANSLSISRHHLTEVINKHLNKNFYEFVNGFRLEEVKDLLVDSSKNHITIVGIAFEAGFSSKTTFNTLFRKETGVTPSAFRKTALDVD